ncbi:cupin domain-containing protein [Flavobacterium sp. Sd200]|uniref:cupin domain-containing protein n=1 Tax=Flavobacterium sp. Sd200 TaxID=2692211 RepID=UPI001368AACE|nr:cupin domain-containing protein [Flavobacterium sp. Sd200]MXN90426.1 cupin domain-containing protein [Flavobacterium sp. Sd200]
MQPRTYHNPVNGEYTSILKSSFETNGDYTHFEVSLTPGGGNPVHYHTGFTEEFTAVKGLLGLQLGKKIIYLKPGETALVPVYSRHRFFNDTNDTIIFRVRLVKGQPGFENFLKAIFGLVNDRKTITGNQIPKNIYHLAIVYKWGDTHLTNPLIKLCAPILNLLYKRAVNLGIEQQLLQRYCSSECIDPDHPGIK